MAIVFTPSSMYDVDSKFGTKKEVRGTVAFDSSQLAAGEAIAKSQIGLSTIDKLDIESFQLSDVLYHPVADLTNSIVDVFQDSDGAIASGVDLSSATAVKFVAIGDI